MALQANEFATSLLDRQTESEPAISRNAVLCDQPAGQRNDFEIIPTIYMESQHSVDGPISPDFSSIYIVRQLWGPQVGSRWSVFPKNCLFGKNDPLLENFQKFVPKGFIVTQIHVLCANFVKFGRLEVGEIAWCLPDKKKQNFRSLCSSCFCTDRAQNLPGPASNYVLRQQQQQPFYGPLSGTTRVSQYQKKHSPTHHPEHHPIFISSFHLPRSIAFLLVQITCLAIFLHNLFPCPLWSASWPGALHLIFHTFLYPISVFFSQRMPMPLQPVLL